MGTMHNSADIVRELISDISKACSDLSAAAQSIRTLAHGDWEDELSQAYSDQMNSIAGLVNEPVSTLEGCGKQMQRLAEALDRYSGIHF